MTGYTVYQREDQGLLRDDSESIDFESKKNLNIIAM